MGKDEFLNGGHRSLQMPPITYSDNDLLGPAADSTGRTQQESGAETRAVPRVATGTHLGAHSEHE